jgi:hypothetical protein
MNIGETTYNKLNKRMYFNLYVNLWNVIGETILNDVWETVNESIWDSVSPTVWSVCRTLTPE